MTTETLIAGQEMDAEIARRVFGWEIDTEATSGTATGEPWWRVPGERYLRNGAPEYSTDIASAWLVVEKMRERGLEFRIVSCGRNEVLVEYWNDLEDEPGSSDGMTDIAPIAPLAICRAALAALEESIKVE